MNLKTTKEVNPMHPKISILMGIYNCADTLRVAIDSIVKQSYTDWEFIVCDDGSQDDTYAIAKEYVLKDPQRFILIKNEKNRGLNHTLNRCLAEAKGDYIARMDGDDISCVDRFQKQVDFLDSHPEYAIVSSNMTFFDEYSEWGQTHAKAEPLSKHFLKSTPICHAPCMVRRESFLAVGGYSVSPKLLRVEDYHLWVKMYAKGYKAYNIQENLYKMRDDRNAETRRTFSNYINEARVKVIAVRMLNLPLYGYAYVMIPIIKALLPKFAYRVIRKSKIKSSG